MSAEPELTIEMKLHQLLIKPHGAEAQWDAVRELRPESDEDLMSAVMSIVGSGQSGIGCKIVTVPKLKFWAHSAYSGQPTYQAKECLDKIREVMQIPRPGARRSSHVLLPRTKRLIRGTT